MLYKRRGLVVPKELLRKLRRIEITTTRLANDQLAGRYASVIRGQGLAFREVRPYQAGDDVRAIDWNVSARMNEAYVKVFVEEREMTVMLVVDASRSQRFGTTRATKIEVAAEVTALSAFSAIRGNDRVGLILATDRVEKIVPPKKGEKHAMRVVREVLGFEPARAGTDLREALSALVKVTKRRSVAFVVSDFFTSGFERALGLAAAKHDVIPVMLVDARDEALPDVGLAEFEDLETGELVVVDTSSRRVREAYAEDVRAARAEKVTLFRKLGLDVVTIDTGGSFVAPIRDLFARRARRARR
ncbi:MAG: DUF58 domain-containing protein [Polyangiaceae bacterium]|nr:DUF58 domain-containing protein [Polyangiaceae bacterium]